MKSESLPNDVKLLLAANSLYKVADLFLGTFFISFIMQNSFGEIAAVSVYNLFLYLALIGGFLLIAKWVKQRDKVAVFRLNIVPRALFLLAIIFMKESIVDYIVPLGILYGLFVALYWSPMHLMTGEKVRTDLMPKFVGYATLVKGVTKVAAPVLLGLFITVGSYTEMAWALLVISVLELAFTFFMKPSMHRSKARVDFAGFYNCMMRFPIIRRLFAIEILRGFSLSALGTVVVMYTVYMFRTDLNLGIFTTVFALVSIIKAYLFGRFAKRHMFKNLLLWSTLTGTIALLAFAAYSSQTTFLAYNFINATAIGILDIIIETQMYNLSKSRCVTKDHKTEYFLFRETALAIGRLSGFAILMMVGIFGGYDWLCYYLGLLAAAMGLMGYMSMRINEHIK
ncbi:MAG: hypothetical protein LBQ49_01645 [Rickettsiales bacterium]|nr:hypothetical protein [Rickettsiales bacterium]